LEEHFGQTVEAFLVSVSHIPLLSGFAPLVPIYQAVFKLCHKTHRSTYRRILMQDCPTLWRIRRNTRTDASFIKEYLDDNLVNIIGVVCGTTPAHIKLIADIAKEYKPRVSTAVM
jgi:5-methyltetrahydrofolate--homocysteine methyltransferase